MKDQLIRLMEEEAMSPAKFADEIGVQRSSISHILSDRNKPSYDFILKILNRFSDLSAEWLLTGMGPMKKNAFIPPKEVKQASLFDVNFAKSQNTTQNIVKNTEKRDSDANSSIQAKSVIQNNKQSEKPFESDSKNNVFTNVTNTKFVVVFYEDGTFERYNSK